MVRFYPRRQFVQEGYEYCPSCKGNGREPIKRQSWEPPIYGDDTTTCSDCSGLGIVPKKEKTCPKE